MKLIQHNSHGGGLTGEINQGISHPAGRRSGLRRGKGGGCGAWIVPVINMFLLRLDATQVSHYNPFPRALIVWENDRIAHHLDFSERWKKINEGVTL